MKNINIRNTVFIAFIAIMSYNVKAQNTTLKTGDNPMIKEPSAVLELESINKGALLSRVKLTSTTVTNPVNAPVNALTVFNTNTTGDVTPGYYYWNATANKWTKLAEDNIWKLEGNALKGTDKDVVFKRNNFPSGLLGENNTAFGYVALWQNTVGICNTAIGDRALVNDVRGKYNTAIGSSAIVNSANGSYNTAVGTFSFTVVPDSNPNYNTAIGLGLENI